jgi:hypothetical protein
LVKNPVGLDLGRPPRQNNILFAPPFGPFFKTKIGQNGDPKNFLPLP